jgi:hypothetical protein
MDIVVRPRSLGLAKYEAIFRENDIDETVLPSLTAEDLKELGVASLGHRRKLLDAIAALRSDASGKAPSADVATAPSATNASPKTAPSGRQVTVMFSDLVSSTALLARIDPEDLRALDRKLAVCTSMQTRLRNWMLSCRRRAAAFRSLTKRPARTMLSPCGCLAIGLWDVSFPLTS